MTVIEAGTSDLVGREANGPEYSLPQAPTSSQAPQVDRALWPGILSMWYIKNANQVSLSFSHEGWNLVYSPLKSVLVTCFGK